MKLDLTKMKMPFGKYTGTPVADLPTNYILWMMDEINWDDEKWPGLQAAVEGEWEKRKKK